MGFLSSSLEKDGVFRNELLKVLSGIKDSLDDISSNLERLYECGITVYNPSDYD